MCAGRKPAKKQIQTYQPRMINDIRGFVFNSYLINRRLYFTIPEIRDEISFTIQSYLSLNPISHLPSFVSVANTL